MKNIIFAILLMVCGVVYGQKVPVYTAKELQQKLETQKIELKQQALEDKVAAQDKSIEEKIAAQDKKIGDADSHLDNSLSWLSIVATLITVGLGFGGFFIISGNREAKQKLEREMNDLKAKMAENIESVRKDAKFSIKQALADIDIMKGEIESLLEKAKGDASNIEKLKDRSKEAFQIIEDTKEGMDDYKKKEVARDAVQEIRETKTESQYTVYDWFVKAYDAHEKELYEEANVYYKKASESEDFENQSEENRAIVYNNWGNVLSDLAKLKGDEKLFEASFEKYRQATQLKADYADAYYNWGGALLDLAKIKDDEKLFEVSFEKYGQATQLKADYVDAYNNWGGALHELAKLKEDETLFEASFEKYAKATQLKADYADAYNDWGNALLSLAKLKGDETLFEASFEKYAKATQLKADDADVYSNWGISLCELSRMKSDERLFEAGIEKYDKATRLKADHADAYGGWGYSLMGLAEMRGSLEEDKDIIKEKLLKAYSLGNTNGVYNLACLYSLLDEKDEAFEWFEKAIQLSENTRKDFETDSDFDNLRQDPRYEELLNKYRPLKEDK